MAEQEKTRKSGDTNKDEEEMGNTFSKPYLVSSSLFLSLYLSLLLFLSPPDKLHVKRLRLARQIDRSRER